MAPYRIIYGIVCALVSVLSDIACKDCSCQPIFRCDNGMYIPFVLRCDGIKNCDDFTDEINCYQVTTGNTDLPCFTDSTAWQGNISQTISNTTCQRWDSQIPHGHRYNSDPNQFPDDTLAEASNFCRDPDKEGHPWCYTTNATVRWEFCGIPRCGRQGCDGFRCDSGHCIPASSVCDNTYDCGDGDISDEICNPLNVVEGCNITIDQFVCSKNVCIPTTWVCDETGHCGDNPEEINCTECTMERAIKSISSLYLPEGFTILPEFQTSYWHHENYIRSHLEAEMICNSYGGHLMIIDSREKRDRIIDITKTVYPTVNPAWMINGHIENVTWIDWEKRELLYTTVSEHHFDLAWKCLSVIAMSTPGVVRANCENGSPAICEFKPPMFEGALQPYDFQVSASSHVGKYVPGMALKMSPEYGWCADVSDQHPFLQVDMLLPMAVTRIHMKGWTEFHNISESSAPKHNVSLKGVKRFLVAKSNTVDFGFVEFEKLENGSEQQGQIFELYTWREVDDIQSFYLCDRREARYIRIYPLEPWKEDLCLNFILQGFWKDVDMDFTCSNNNQEVGLFNVGFGLDRKRHHSSCNASTTNVSTYDDVCVANFSLFSVVAESNMEQLLLNTSSHCKDRCLAESDCTMVKYCLYGGTCSIYTGHHDDLPVVNKETADEIIYQRLCLAKGTLKDGIRKYVVTEEQRTLYSPGYPLRKTLEAEEKFDWTIDFSKTTVYPVLLFEDVFFDDGVLSKLDVLGNSRLLFENVSRPQLSVISSKHVCHLNVYYRYGTRAKEIRFGFRALVANSAFSGSYKVADNIESFYEHIGIITSKSFSGIYSDDVTQYKIINAVSGYITLDILDFYVSCSNTGKEKSDLTIETAQHISSFCNLQRPWKRLKFPPTEGDIVIRLLLHSKTKDQQLDGITANFNITGYMERRGQTNESYTEVERIQNAFNFGLADVAILMDATYTSIYKDDPRLEHLEKLVLSLSSTVNDTNDETRVGLGAFSDDAEVFFQLKDGWNKTDMVSQLRNFGDKAWRRRCLYCALGKMRNIMFNQFNGDRHGVPNIAMAILLDSPFSAAASKNEIKFAQSEGIHVFIIHIGQDRLNELTAAIDVSDPFQLSVHSIMHKMAYSVKDAFDKQKVPVLQTVWKACSEEACYAFYPPTGKTGTEFFQTRSDANETCNNNHNGSLASIHSLSELQFIRHYLEKWIINMKRSYDPSYSVYVEQVHIDEMTVPNGSNKTIYHWSDGTPVVFTGWSEEVLRMEQQRICVILALWKIENDNIWKVGDCEESSFYFLCKYGAKTNDVTDVSLASDGIHFTPTLEIKEGSYFICRSIEYVNIFFKCDGIRDCFDGSDEANCSQQTTLKANCEGMFHCGSGECAPYSQYCDYIPDCKDHSDEDCDFAPCNETEWRCTNGQCIHSTLRCNGFVDCLDRSDEISCATCASGSYGCADGICISNLRVCNGLADCTDSSDEDNCNPWARESCLDWWKAGYRTTGIYKLTVGAEVLDFECDFERVESEGVIVTKFHDVDRDGHDGFLLYRSASVLVSFLRNELCKQSFKQTCPPNRKALSENMDLTSHEEYWDCLCIEMTVNMIDSTNTTLRACSNVTQQLVDDRTICLEDWWFYKIDFDGVTDVAITRSHQNQRYPTSFFQKLRLILGPITCEEKVHNIPPEIVCRRGKPVDVQTKCLYDVDDFGRVEGCTDFTHLQNCDTFICPLGYFKCPHSFCIAQRFVCDGEIDCLSGADEAICSSSGTAMSLCPGSFKCKGTKICLPHFQLCNGKFDCPDADDERNCGLVCPQQCSCTGFEITCDEVDRLDFQSLHPMKGSVLHLTRSSVADFPILNMPWLAILNVSASKIRSLTPGVFGKMRNLLLLDLSYNSIRTLYSYAFEGLSKLNVLRLEGNYFLSHISPNAFVGLQKITSLLLRNTQVTQLETNTFLGLTLLTHLDLSQNQITSVEVGAFVGLQKLISLDMSSNKISTFDKSIFSELVNLEHLITDEYMFCCLKPESVTSENCLPHEDEFSSCSDLMRMDGPRYLLWIIGLLALFGNCLALAYRIIFDRARLKIGYGIFVTNLCVSDFFMGIYLVIIAGADLYYRDIYVWNDKTWRYGGLCNFAGVLSTLSSEASVFFICLVTIDRLLVIKYPFGQFKFTTKVATVASSVSWIVALLVALLPLLYKDYFQDGFYSKNAVCLALPLTSDKPNGWEYSLTIFVFLNFATFLLIAVGQWLLYRQINSGERNIRTNQKLNDLKVARNLLLVVVTDFLCWCPIGVMGLMALSGHVISGDIYVWACVLILPINSALNPFLYTFSAISNRKVFVPSVDEQSGLVYVDSRSVQTLWTSTEFKPSHTGQPYVSLDVYLQSERLNQVQVRNLLEMLKTRIQKLHSLEFYHGDLSTDKISIQQHNGDVTEMELVLTPKPVMKPEDIALDMKRFAFISKQLLMCVADKHTEL